MGVYLGVIYTPIVFGGAAPNVPSLIGSKVIFRAQHCVRSNSCISWRISFKFCVRMYLGLFYTPFVFGGAAPYVPSFIGPKVIFGWHSCVHSLSCISWRISFKFCIRMYLGKIYVPIFFWRCCPQCPVFYRVKGIFLVHILVCALSAAFLDDFFFFQILYGGVSW